MKRRHFLAALAATVFASGSFPVSAADTNEPILIGVSGPLTGPRAQYGAQWQLGFDLALEEINANGGIDGRKLDYVFEDSQSDPKQSVAIARKFTTNPQIVVEVGDFASPASMAASPIYQRAGLVQFGFTNSHPDFTKGGDYMWSNSISQAEEQPKLAEYAVKGLGLKKIAVLHLNTDWGRTSKDNFISGAEKLGASVVVSEGYLPDERDFRSTLVRVRDANPDGIALISYYSDGALIANQLKATGIDLPIVAVGSVYSPKFLELGGDSVEGIHTLTNFFPDDPRPHVREFVDKFVTKYGHQPDSFSARAYDTFILLASVIRQYGTDRTAIRDGLAKINNVPSVIYGEVTFDPATRRVDGAEYQRLVVKNGEFTLWQPEQASN